MKRRFLTALMLVGIVGSASAQHDDLYFVPKKKKTKTEVAQTVATDEKVASSASSAEKTLSVTAVPAKGLTMDEDAYNRRGSYLTEQGDAVSQFAMSDEGFVLITEEGDTMWMNTDTLRLTRIEDGEGWVNGFNGSESDYEYAMRIIRFRNPRYAIPVSSPLYWDVVYGGALWPSWDWNIYDDGLFAYVFPTSSNWHYWDYSMSYPFGWGPWGNYWGWHHGHYGGMLHMGHGYWGWNWYGHVWYDPWFNPHFYDYCAGWYPGWNHHWHNGFYPGLGGGGGLQARRNDRHADVASTRRGIQDNGGVGRGTTASSRQGSVATRGENGSTRSSSVRVVTGRNGSSSSSAVRTSTGRSGGYDEMVRRGGSSSASSVSRGATGGNSRSTYSRQSTSRSNNSGASSSYSRPSSTRSSSSSVSRTSSSSRSGVYSTGSGSSSSSSRSSSSSSSRSSYSSSSSFSSSSSYSGGSYSGSSSRSGGSYSGGSSRSGGSSSGSRR